MLTYLVVLLQVCAMHDNQISVLQLHSDQNGCGCVLVFLVREELHTSIIILRFADHVRVVLLLEVPPLIFALATLQHWIITDRVIRALAAAVISIPMVILGLHADLHLRLRTERQSGDCWAEGILPVIMELMQVRQPTGNVMGMDARSPQPSCLQNSQESRARSVAGKRLQRC